MRGTLALDLCILETNGAEIMDFTRSWSAVRSAVGAVTDNGIVLKFRGYIWLREEFSAARDPHWQMLLSVTVTHNVFFAENSQGTSSLGKLFSRWAVR